MLSWTRPTVPGLAHAGGAGVSQPVSVLEPGRDRDACTSTQSPIAYALCAEDL